MGSPVGRNGTNNVHAAAEAVVVERARHVQTLATTIERDAADREDRACAIVYVVAELLGALAYERGDGTDLLARVLRVDELRARYEHGRARAALEAPPPSGSGPARA